MKKVFVVLIILVVAVLVFAMSYYQNQNHDQSEKSITETVRLCETENPRFNLTLECQKVIDTNYSGKKCTFDFDSTEFLSLGSCTNCNIICE